MSDPTPGQGPPTPQEREDWGNQARWVLGHYAKEDIAPWWAWVALRLLAALTATEAVRDAAQMEAYVAGRKADYWRRRWQAAHTTQDAVWPSMSSLRAERDAARDEAAAWKARALAMNAQAVAAAFFDSLMNDPPPNATQPARPDPDAPHQLGLLEDGA